MIVYLSFTGPTGWIAGCFAEAADNEAALWEVTRRGLNPGGTVSFITVPYALKELLWRRVDPTNVEEVLACF